MALVFIASAAEQLLPSMSLCRGRDEDGPYNGFPYCLNGIDYQVRPYDRRIRLRRHGSRRSQLYRGIVGVTLVITQQINDKYR